jgi:hypothetical protein
MGRLQELPLSLQAAVQHSYFDMQHGNAIVQTLGYIELHARFIY